MGQVRDLAEQLWTGDKSTADHNPLTTFVGLESFADGLAFISSFGNVTVLDTDDGLVMLDTGGFVVAKTIHKQIRDWSDRPVHTAVYTHGHADHVFGVGPFDEEVAASGGDRPNVIAHEAVAARFDRYKLTAGYNSHINARQFRVPGLRWPTEYRYPDQTYRDTLALTIGGVDIELHHDKGETDDHTWAWIPTHKAICTGDLFIWAAPNCGNPQKVQRFPKEWSVALRKMTALKPELLFPGHGPPIVGGDRVEQALTETAELLDSVHDQTLDMMNAGKCLDEILHSVSVPAHLLERPYLRPVYDEPMFIVRNIWRLYGGWYDGNPARLKPPGDAALASEVAQLSGGAGALAARAKQVAAAGDLALACQLAEWASQADPDNDDARQVRAAVYRERSEAETSLMARSIYLAAASEK